MNGGPGKQWMNQGGKSGQHLDNFGYFRGNRITRATLTGRVF